MFVRFMSAVAAVVVLVVFLLPATMAISAAVNGPAWDLQDLPAFPAPLLLAGIFALGLLLPSIRLGFGTLANASHPITQVPLFELDCALIR